MTGRYVEVNIDETNELVRISCPECKYPMRVLAKHANNVYRCYCAACQTDRYMKDTIDTEKLTFKEFYRCMKRGKGISLEEISDLVYELYNENEQLKQAIKDLAQQFQDNIKFDKKQGITEYPIDWVSYIIHYFKEVI